MENQSCEWFSVCPVMIMTGETAIVEGMEKLPETINTQTSVFMLLEPYSEPITSAFSFDSEN